MIVSVEESHSPSSRMNEHTHAQTFPIFESSDELVVFRVHPSNSRMESSEWGFRVSTIFIFAPDYLPN